jgi:hypothetical protein
MLRIHVKLLAQKFKKASKNSQLFINFLINSSTYLLASYLLYDLYLKISSGQQHGVDTMNDEIKHERAHKVMISASVRMDAIDKRLYQQHTKELFNEYLRARKQWRSICDLVTTLEIRLENTNN